MNDTRADNERIRRSEMAIQRFIAHNPPYRIGADQPAFRAGTNVTTVGSRARRPVVFKYFEAADRWVNELRSLRHFSQSGLVPEVLDIVPESLIVMSFLPGIDVGAWVALNPSPPHLNRLSEDVGRAIARIVSIPVSSAGESYSPARDFSIIPWGMRLSGVVARYALLGRRIQALIPAYRTPFFDASLALIEAEAAALDGRPQILFHEDIANMRVNKGRFAGFYDLEMCRCGVDSMQLGVALGLCGQRMFEWNHLQRGYVSATAQPLEEDTLFSALAMHHLYVWIRICRWGWLVGDASERDHLDASTALVSWADQLMRNSCAVLRSRLDLSRWFPDGL